jgi:hypothetical protein
MHQAPGFSTLPPWRELEGGQKKQIVKQFSTFYK